MEQLPDFDTLRLLAEANPAAFFALRERLIESFIASAPEKATELRALQARIDGLRASAGTPMNALAGLMSMLSDHLEALHVHTSLLGQQLRCAQESMQPR